MTNLKIRANQEEMKANILFLVIFSEVKENQKFCVREKKEFQSVIVIKSRFMRLMSREINPRQRQQ